MLELLLTHGQRVAQLGEDLGFAGATASRCVARLLLALFIVPGMTSEIVRNLSELYWTINNAVMYTNDEFYDRAGRIINFP